MGEHVIKLGVDFDVNWNKLTSELKGKNVEIEAEVSLDGKGVTKEVRKLKKEVSKLDMSSPNIGQSLYDSLGKAVKLFDALNANADEMGRDIASIGDASKLKPLNAALENIESVIVDIQSKAESLFADGIIDSSSLKGISDIASTLRGSADEVRNNINSLVSGLKGAGAKGAVTSPLDGVAKKTEEDAKEIKAAAEQAGRAAKEAAKEIDGAEATKSPLSKAREKMEKDAEGIEDAKEKAAKAAKGVESIASGDLAGSGKKTSGKKKKSGVAVGDNVSGGTTTSASQGKGRDIAIDTSTFDIAVSALNGSAGELSGAAGALKGAATELSGAAALIGSHSNKNAAGLETQPVMQSIADSNSKSSLSAGNIPSPISESKYASSRSDFDNWGNSQGRGYRAYTAAADSALEMSRSAIAKGAVLDVGGVEIPYAEVKLDKTDFSSLVLNNDAQEYMQRLGKGDPQSRAPIEGNFTFDYASSDIRDVYRNGNSEMRNLSLGRAADPHQVYREFEERHNGITIEGLQALAKKNPEAFQEHVNRILENGGFVSLRPDMKRQRNDRDGKLRWVKNNDIDVAQDSILTDLLGKVREDTSFRSVDTYAQKSEEKRTSIPKYEKTIKTLTGMSGEEWSLLSDEKQDSKRQSLDKGQKSSLTKAVNARKADLAEQNRIISEIAGLDAETFLALGTAEQNLIYSTPNITDTYKKSGDAQQALTKAVAEWKRIKDPYGDWLSSESVLSGAKGGLQSQLEESLNDNDITRHKSLSNYTNATARQLANYNSNIKGDSRRTAGLVGGDLFAVASTWQPEWAEQWVTALSHNYYKRDEKYLNSEIGQSKAKISALQQLYEKGFTGTDAAKKLMDFGISQDDLIEHAMNRAYGTGKKVTVEDPDSWFRSGIESLIEQENEKLHGRKLTDSERAELAEAKLREQKTREALSLEEISGLKRHEVESRNEAWQEAKREVERLEGIEKVGLIEQRDKAKISAQESIAQLGNGGWEFKPEFGENFGDHVASRVLDSIIVTPTKAGQTESFWMNADVAEAGIEYSLGTLEGSRLTKARNRQKEANDAVVAAEEELNEKKSQRASLIDKYFGDLDEDETPMSKTVVAKAKESYGLSELEQGSRDIADERTRIIRDSDAMLRENESRLHENELQMQAVRDKMSLLTPKDGESFDPENYASYQLLEQETDRLKKQRSTIELERSQIESQRQANLEENANRIKENRAQRSSAMLLAEHELGLSSDDEIVAAAKQIETLSRSISSLEGSGEQGNGEIERLRKEAADADRRVRAEESYALTSMGEDRRQKISDDIRMRTEKAISSAFDQGLITENQANEFRDRLSKIVDYGTVVEASEQDFIGQQTASKEQSSEDRVKNYLKSRGFSDDDIESFVKNASPKLQEVLQNKPVEMEIDTSGAEPKLEELEQEAQQAEQAVGSIGGQPVDLDVSPAKQDLDSLEQSAQEAEQVIEGVAEPTIKTYDSLGDIADGEYAFVNIGQAEEKLKAFDDAYEEAKKPIEERYEKAKAEFKPLEDEYRELEERAKSMPSVEEMDKLTGDAFAREFEAIKSGNEDEIAETKRAREEAVRKADDVAKERAFIASEMSRIEHETPFLEQRATVATLEDYLDPKKSKHIGVPSDIHNFAKQAIAATSFEELEDTDPELARFLTAKEQRGIAKAELNKVNKHNERTAEWFKSDVLGVGTYTSLEDIPDGKRGLIDTSDYNAAKKAADKRVKQLESEIASTSDEDRIRELESELDVAKKERTKANKDLEKARANNRDTNKWIEERQQDAMSGKRISQPDDTRTTTDTFAQPDVPVSESELKGVEAAAEQATPAAEELAGALTHISSEASGIDGSKMEELESSVEDIQDAAIGAGNALDKLDDTSDISAVTDDSQKPTDSGEKPDVYDYTDGFEDEFTKSSGLLEEEIRPEVDGSQANAELEKIQNNLEETTNDAHELEEAGKEALNVAGNGDDGKTHSTTSPTPTSDDGGKDGSDDKKPKDTEKSAIDAAEALKRLVSISKDGSLQATDEAIKDIRSAMHALGMDDYADTFIRQIEEMGNVFFQTSAKIKADDTIDISVKGIDEVGNAIELMATLSDVSKDAKVSNVSLGMSTNESKAAAAEAKAATQEIKDLKQAYKDVTDLKIKLVGLDEGSEEAKELTRQLGVAEERFKSLGGEFGMPIVSLLWSKDQNEELNRYIEKQDARLRLKNAQHAARTLEKSNGKDDVEAQKAAAAAVREEINALKQAYKDVTNLKMQLVGLDESSVEARKLTDELRAAEDNLESLKATAKGDWTQDQIDDYDKFTSRQDTLLSLKNAKFVDKQTTADIKAVDNAVDELIKAEKDASKLRIKIDGLDENSAEAKQLKSELTDVEGFINEIKSSLRMDSGASSLLNDEQAKKYAKAMKDVANETARASAKAEDLAAKESDKRTKKGQSITDKYDRSTAGKGWADHINLGRQYKSLDSPDGKTRQLMTDYAFDYHALTEAIDKYNIALKESGADSERTIQAYNEMVAAQERLTKSYDSAKHAISVDKGRNKELQDNEKLLQQQQSLLLKLEAWKKKSSKVFNSQSADAKELVEEYNRLEQAIKDCDNVSDLRDLNVGFGDLKNKVKAAGLEGESVIESMKNKFTEYARYAVASFGVMEVVQGLKMMAQEVLEVDTAMTGLLRVTEMTNSETEVMFDKMIDSAKEYGRTLTDTINATADWVRAGFDENTALGLAEVTAMYQNVSDLDYDEASENLLTSYRGFEKQLMSDYEGDTVAAVEHITDVLNELDNQYSVTSAGLGEGLARSASALQIAGNTFEESAA